jgi:hypothetical protein
MKSKFALAAAATLLSAGMAYADAHAPPVTRPPAKPCSASARPATTS